jgi:uncharacterized protein YjbI with pentapeptide repeats
MIKPARVQQKTCNTRLEAHKKLPRGPRGKPQRRSPQWPNLAFLDVSAVDFSGADLTNALFAGANLNGAIYQA